MFSVNIGRPFGFYHGYSLIVVYSMSNNVTVFIHF